LTTKNTRLFAVLMGRPQNGTPGTVPPDPLSTIRTRPGEGCSAVAAARPPVARSLSFPAYLDGVDASTMSGLFVFVSIVLDRSHEKIVSS